MNVRAMCRARVAQSAELRICNLKVAGSTPAVGSQIGGNHAPTPPKAGPLHQASGGLNTQPAPVRVAHAGLVGTEDSNTATRSQGDVSPAALMRVGDLVLPSAPGRGAKASEWQRPAGASPRVVRRTDGVAPVAQPGSAPQPELPVAEVGRSNRLGVSAEPTGGRSAERSGERLGSSTPETKGIFAEVMLLGWSVTVALLGERRAFNPGGAGSTPAGDAGLCTAPSLASPTIRMLLGTVSAVVGALGCAWKSADDDGAKTPRLCSAGILCSENDATDTLPKLWFPRVKAEVVTAGETAQSGSTGIDVEQEASLIVLAASVRQNQPANVNRERQLGTRSRPRGVNGVGCVRSSSSSSGVSTRAGLQRARVGAAAEIRCGGGGAAPGVELLVLRTSYARERGDAASLTDRGSTPRGSTTSSQQWANEVLRVHLGIAGRPATASASLAETVSAEPAPIARAA